MDLYPYYMSSIRKVCFPQPCVRYVSEVALAAKRLRCVKMIDSGEVEHPGPHIHSNESQPFHFCESR